MKVSPTPAVNSMVSSLNISNANSKSEIASHWLHTLAALTIMDSNQPEPLMKLPIPIEQNSLKYHTRAFFSSAPTLNFVSNDFWHEIVF